MKHWFLDTNVLIDFLADRQPFAAAANDIFRLAHAGSVRLYVASLSFSNAFYLIRRSLAAAGLANYSLVAQQTLATVKPLLTVVAVDDHTVTHALQAGFSDFEDALQSFAAQSVPEIELLVTRNGKDFGLSSLPVADPIAALQSLGQPTAHPPRR